MNPSNTGCELHLGNSFSLIDSLEAESIQLTVTSPPYNIGKIYERRANLDDYLADYEVFAKHLFNKTSTSGSVCWQVGNYVDKGEVFPLDIFFYPIFKSAGFSLRNRVVWHFAHGLHATRRLSGRYETILWFTKSDDYVFNLDPIRVPAKYPGKRGFKGQRKGEPTSNPLGKNPSDIWNIVARDWEEMVWDIPNVKANHPEKTTHPAQFPIELVERCILALTNESDTVLDPFLGTGTAALAALTHSRKFVGFELSPEYMAISESRIQDLKAGTLKRRALGKPVHQPTGREKVARPPNEWNQTQLGESD